MPFGNGLSGIEMAGYAHNAGFSGDNLVTAVAIAKAESGLNPKAHNAVPPDDSYGLFQINMIGSMGPSRRARFGITSNDQLFDPLTNSRAAFSVSGGGVNFTPWSTFTNGAYKSNIEFANESVRALKAAGPNYERDLVAGKHPGSAGNPIEFGGQDGLGLPSPGDALKSLDSVPAAIASAANALTGQFTKLGGNFLAVGIALVLLVVGILLLSHNAIGSAVKAVK